jgi:uncharacterized RDD family membrane protein YckC
MNCPQCGDICHCLPEHSPAAVVQWMPDSENDSASATSLAPTQVASMETTPPESDAAASNMEDQSAQDPAGASSATEPEGSAWRDELSVRLNRYRSRRKARPPRYPSLRLRFDEPSHATSSAPTFETVSSQALALDQLAEAPETVDREIEPVQGQGPAQQSQSRSQATARPSAKIIEFPRLTVAPPPTPLDELAAPVIDRPRILEAPEIAPPAPALGGITMEGIRPRDAEKQPGIDIPLQSAPLGRRILAAAVDALIVASASALFGFIFWKVAATRPPLIQLLGLAAGISCLFWAAYQYLLIVYAASTPGLRLAGLQLARFDGTPANRRLRRWRVFASYLSAVSMGMGYAWVFLDEDALCWHDRITHTYLAPTGHASAPVEPADSDLRS